MSFVQIIFKNDSGLRDYIDIIVSRGEVNAVCRQVKITNEEYQYNGKSGPEIFNQISNTIFH